MIEKPKSIKRQMAILRKLFPGIRLSNLGKKLSKREFVEENIVQLAIPKWKKIAPTYSEAVVKVFGLIEKTRNIKIIILPPKVCDAKHLRQTKKTILAWNEIEKKQKDKDVFIVPIENKLKFKECTAKEVSESVAEKEFSLGLFEIGIIALTHPEIINDKIFSWISCYGDEYSRKGNRSFLLSCHYQFSNGAVTFHTWGKKRSLPYYATVSGFID